LPRRSVFGIWVHLTTLESNAEIPDYRRADAFERVRG
jgi:hypothetical protein